MFTKIKGTDKEVVNPQDEDKFWREVFKFPGPWHRTAGGGIARIQAVIVDRGSAGAQGLRPGRAVQESNKDTSFPLPLVQERAALFGGGDFTQQQRWVSVFLDFLFS